MSTEIPERPEGRYRHYKGGLYRVIGIARHSESREQLVVYVAETDTAEMWVRPASMFFEDIDIEGRRLPRFTRLD